MLHANDLFSLDGREFRLLAVDAPSDTAWIIDTKSSNPLPKLKSYERLQEKKKSKDLVIVTSKSALVTSRASPKAQLRSQKAWQAIKPLIESSAIFNPSSRSDMVNQRARELKCSPQTLMKYLRMYWIGGQSIASLLGDFHNCGTNGEGTELPRGRKPVNTIYEPYVLTAKDKKNIEQAIRKHHLQGELVSVPAAHQRMLEENYSYLDGNGHRALKQLGEVPSMRQFRYLLRKLISTEESIRKRKGNTIFDKDHRPKLGIMSRECNGIGHIYEIDATIADVFLVSKWDRARIIGKPTLYLIYDRRSRLCVGFYVGLEAASWPAATQAIVSIFEDKETLCHRYKVPYDPADWPAHGLMPEKFIGDKGEMMSKNSTALAADIHTIVENAMGCRPDLKYTVESGFRLTQESMKDSVPGYEPPANVTKRRGKKYYKDASLNLDEFTTYILAAIIKRNRSVIAKNPIPMQGISESTLATPINIWNSEAQTRGGSLRRYDADFVRLSLLPQDTASISNSGIKFRGIHYFCQEALDRGWLVTSGTTYAKVSYDPRLVDTIYIHDASNRKNFITAHVIERDEKVFRGMSFVEAKLYGNLIKTLVAKGQEHDRQMTSDFHAITDPIGANARKEAKAASAGRSRKARRADTKKDREEERDERRIIEADMLAASSAKSPQQDAPMRMSSNRPDEIFHEQTQSEPQLSATQLALKQQFQRMLPNG